MADEAVWDEARALHRALQATRLRQARGEIGAEEAERERRRLIDAVSGPAAALASRYLRATAAIRLEQTHGEGAFDALFPFAVRFLPAGGEPEDHGQFHALDDAREVFAFVADHLARGRAAGEVVLLDLRANEAVLVRRAIP